MEEEEQARPLALASPTVHPVADGGSIEVESGRKISFISKRRCVLRCCGCCSATVVVLGVTILVLALTVFKVKDAELTMNRIHIDRLFVPGLGTADQLVSINATLTADISIKNPNAASFRFRSSISNFYYGGETVGVVYAPDGNVKAHRTVRMNVTVDVLIDRAMSAGAKSNGGEVFDGEIDMSSYTDIAGRVKVLGLLKKDMEIQLNCTFTVDVFSRTVSNKVCQTHAH